MAKEQTSPVQNPQEPAQPPVEKQPFFTKKALLLGVPIFLLQLGLIYFLATKYIIASPDDSSAGRSAKSLEQNEEPAQGLFLVKDVIVNPAGTNGTRFLLATVGFEVTTQEVQRELEKKEVQVRDALNTILTSRGLDELADVNQREILRSEIAKRVGELVKSSKPPSVYFSKFIIQ